ncbi:unnamed protein product [Cuscuta campestris]|uniref:H15 domain-containing protein n=1 Tax=Cuscuta campestris TaxID=132261 RepID=A0A484M9G8_9ASTE|nr:unnamed protein product [Cuscuta campestris]
MAINTAGKPDAAGKAKKAAVTKKPLAHPPYAEMITEAIVALKERTGSSLVAIAKFIEDKEKDLPPNFRKLLLGQLKKLVVSGKLTKVKNSFKISRHAKPADAAPEPIAALKKAVTAAAKPKAVTKKVALKKPKVTTPAKKPVTKAAAMKKTPVKKVALSKIKKTPMKKTKSTKSPAKKARK